MKYPSCCKNVIDVTKAPYYADNKGIEDSTAAIRRAIDDCLRDYPINIEKTRKELLSLYEERGENVYIGSEAARVVNGNVLITFPKELPKSRIIYFPSGTYLVSDTLTYTLENLSTRQQVNYTCELCRNIHIMGQSKETTVIRLKDNSQGFEQNSKKPLISFNRASIENRETTNCAHMNTLEDITLDLGCGNGGAVGVLYASSNCGRIENVNILAQGGFSGIEFDYGSECCVTDVKISGFDYGIKTVHTSPIVFDGAELSNNKIAAVLTKNGNLSFRNTACGGIPMFCFEKSELGRYFCYDNNATYIGDPGGNYIFHPDVGSDNERDIPSPKRSYLSSECAFVDDFGAIGDGVTDSTLAIQKAMNSGRAVVLFGEGKYRIERTVRVPATVEVVDFMYASLSSGKSLSVGEMDSAFEIFENGAAPIAFLHLSSFDEDFSGFFRFCKQSAKRDAIFKDLCLSAPLYFNTVGGSRLYFDNCFTLTTHYSQDAALHRDGYTPVFCRMIPIELHSQRVYAKNLNIERADLELLCEDSEVLIDGYKTEGPGKMIKAVKGSSLRVNLFNSAWWGNKLSENELFEARGSSLQLVGGNVFCYSSKAELSMALRVSDGDSEYRKTLTECSFECIGKDDLGRECGRLIERLVI